MTELEHALEAVSQEAKKNIIRHARGSWPRIAILFAERIRELEAENESYRAWCEDIWQGRDREGEHLCFKDGELAAQKDAAPRVADIVQRAEAAERNLEELRQAMQQIVTVNPKAAYTGNRFSPAEWMVDIAERALSRSGTRPVPGGQDGS